MLACSLEHMHALMCMAINLHCLQPVGLHHPTGVCVHRQPVRCAQRCPTALACRRMHAHSPMLWCVANCSTCIIGGTCNIECQMQDVITTVGCHGVLHCTLSIQALLVYSTWRVLITTSTRVLHYRLRQACALLAQVMHDSLQERNTGVYCRSPQESSRAASRSIIQKQHR